jgi:hypothetical protein
MDVASTDFLDAILYILQDQSIGFATKNMALRGIGYTIDIGYWDILWTLGYWQ